LPTILDIQKFLSLSTEGVPVVDVRTPKEFEQGRIPGAINMPLFTNEERVVVGTLYKREGKQAAILKGLELVGPKMSELVIQAQQQAKNNAILVHCWRGGMRSGSVAWLLELYGLKVFTLKGGYKSFRKAVLTSFSKPFKIMILGGKTGSAKTPVLEKMAELGEQVLNLEKMAAHKGSAFGALGEKPQPSQEQFENELAIALQHIDEQKIVWLEDESRLIGKKVIPERLWNQMRSARTIYMQLPLEERVVYLSAEYGKFPREQLKEAIEKITKRLGHLQAKNALDALAENDLKTTCRICLSYYDRSYTHGVDQRAATTIQQIDFNHIDIDAIAQQLIDHTKNNVL
jgi:tRNA 2-selenouridine synthase